VAFRRELLQALLSRSRSIEVEGGHAAIRRYDDLDGLTSIKVRNAEGEAHDLTQFNWRSGLVETALPPHALRVDVWIGRHTFSFTSNIDVIKDDLARAYTVRRAVRGRDAEGVVDYDREEPLLTICAHVVAQQRASKNRLLDLFCKLRECNGWTVVRFDEEETTNSPFDKAKGELAAERAEALADAPSIPDADFIELDEKVQNGAALSPDERIVHEKNQLERTVGLPLTPDLIELNRNGRLLDRIETLAKIVSLSSGGYLEDLVRAYLSRLGEPNARLQNMPLPHLIAVLASVAGLATPKGFDLAAAISSRQLNEFARLCRTNRTVIEEITGQAIRRDLEKKPVKHLNLFLAMVGLRLELVAAAKSDGKKVRHYKLDTITARRMLHLAGAFLGVEARRETTREA
jgi:hypothetical protein